MVSGPKAREREPTPPAPRHGVAVSCPRWSWTDLPFKTMRTKLSSSCVPRPSSVISDYKDVPTILQVPASMADANIENVSAVVFGKPFFWCIPNELYQASQTAINCSSTQQSTTVSLNVTFSGSRTLSWSNTVTNTNAAAVQVSYNGPGFGVPGFNVGSTVSYSQSLATSEQSSKGESISISRGGSVSISLPAKTKHTATPQA
jgi:hypothetical protein